MSDPDDLEDTLRSLKDEVRALRAEVEELKETGEERWERRKRELRAELLALHLGDDLVVDETTAARILGVHRETLAKRRRQGEIPAGEFGRSPRYTIGQIRRICQRTTD